MKGFVPSFVVFADIVDLGMTIVARCDTIGGTGFDDLIELELAITPARFRQSRLQKPAAATATVVVRPVRLHVDKILFAHNRFDGIP